MGILCSICSKKKKSHTNNEEKDKTFENLKNNAITIKINQNDKNNGKIFQNINNIKYKNSDIDNNKTLANCLNIEKELISNFKYFNVFWYDPNKTKDFDYLKNYFKNVEVREESELNSAYNFFKKESISEWIVVTPGSKGEELINKLKDFDCIKSFFIFCMDVKSHERWAKKIKKVGCITSKAELLCQKFVEINKEYIFPNFNYQRKKNNNNLKMIENFTNNSELLFLSPKIKSMHDAKIIERNKYNKFCMKLLNYLNRKDLEKYLNDIFSSENNPFYAFKQIIGQNNKDIMQSNLNNFKGLILLSLYFNKYPYILNLLNFEEIKKIVDDKEFKFESLLFPTTETDKIIDKLSKKIMKGESILDEENDIRELQKNAITDLTFKAKLLLGTNLCDYYQIINFIRDADFCLKLIIIQRIPYFFKLKNNFLDEVLISLNISDIRIKHYILYLFNILAKNEESHFNENEINLINDSLTIKDFIIIGDNAFHKKFIEVEKKIKPKSFKYLNIENISNYLNGNKKQKPIVPYFYFLIIKANIFSSNYEKIISSSLEFGITFLIFLYCENDYIIPKNSVNFLLPTIVVYSPEDILKYLSQKLNFYDPLIMPNLKKYVNLEDSNVILNDNIINDPDECFELSETFDKNLIFAKHIFKFLDNIDYILEFTKNIYNIYKEHNALDIFFNKYCLYFGWRLYPELVSFNICFVKRFLYIYCREDKKKSFYKIMNDDLRSKNPKKIEKYFNILALINQCIEEKWLISYGGTVYRGTNINENLIKTFFPGKKLINTAFVSTSKDYNVAKKFLENKNRNCFIIIKALKNNIDIDNANLSPYNEKEVLFLPYNEFKVDNISTEIKIGKKIFTIELTDLGSKYFATYDNMQVEIVDNVGAKGAWENFMNFAGGLNNVSL